MSSTPGDDGTYVSQDTVQFTATFNNTVTVTGTPQLKFSLGGTANDGHRNADYASGSPGTELVFEYTVLATDESTAHGIGVRSDPINLNAGDITRNANTVQLYRRSRGGDGTHRVNYAPPNFLSGATATDGMSIVLTFDQDLKGTTVPNAHFTVTVDGEAASLSGTTAAVSGTTVTLSLTDTLIGANTVTVRYTDPTDGNDVSAIQDLLGNDAASFTADMVTNTVAADPPDAPTGVTATTTRTRDVTLDWTAPSDTGSTAISGYQIEVSTDSGVNWGHAEADTGSTDTTYKHEGLTPNTRYDYRVSAINADGAGTASGVVNTTTAVEITISSIAITSDPDPDGAISCQDNDTYIAKGISVPGTTSRSEVKVTVTFSAAVDVQTPTTGKTIALEIGGQTKLAAYSSGSGTTALVYQYDVEVGLEDQDGISFPANPLRGGGIVTKDQGEGFEADLTHAAIADDAGHKVDGIALTFVRAEASADNATFTLVYSEPICLGQVSFYPDRSDVTNVWPYDEEELRVNGSTVQFDYVYPLQSATPEKYGVTASAWDFGGNPAPISLVSFTTASTTPTAPQNLTALPGNARVTLTWDAPDSDGGRAIDSYESRYSSDGGNNWSDWTEIPGSGPGGMNRSRYRVMGLTNGTTYTLELRAITTADGDGAAAQTTGMPREPGAIGVTIAIDPTSPVAEDGGTVTVTVTAKNNEATVPEAGVAVTVSTANGTAMAGEDFESLSETVTFAVADFALVAAGTHWEASEDLTLTITEDDVDEDDETFEIRLAASGDSASEVSLGAGITVTITDDDEVPGAPTLTARAGDEEVTLEWTAPANPGTSPIDGYDYRVSDGEAMTWDPDWTAIPDSGAGGANASSYTVTMHGSSTLANGNTYTFDVRARSAAGEGEAARDTTKPGEVCGRTRQIAEAITAAAPVSACGDVTATHLAAITTLDLSLKSIDKLKTGDFAGLTGMLNLSLELNDIIILPEGIFSGLTALTGLWLHENNIAALPAGVFDDLTALRTLNLRANALTELPPDIFDKLTALKSLLLGNNQLASLRADVFEDLAALEKLKIAGNYLTEVPAALFSQTPKLRELFADDNRLSALPAGLFSGLSDLEILWLQENPGSPFALTVSLAKVGASEFRATIREGAPFEIVLSLTISGGTIDGDATSLTVSKGSVESTTLEVTRTAESTDAVSVDIGPLPGLPTDVDSNGNLNHQGYALTKSDDLPLDVVPALMSTAVTLSVDPAEVAEDAGETTLTVTGTLNGAVRSEETVVTLSVEAGTATATDDYSTGPAPMLTIATGDQSATATLTLTPVDDNATEDGETVTIGGTVSGGALTVTAVEVTITDNDELPGAPTLSTEAGDQEVTLKWTAPANAGTSTIDGYDYRVSDDAGGTWDPDWTAIANSGAGGANAGSYTVTMHGGSTLLNGTSYTFEVRARSAAGGGPEAQATTTPGEVCGRTKEIADAIVAEASVTACGDVTTAHLAAITELTKTGGDIQALKSGDFAGLSALTKLNLSNNVIQTLPTDIFADVSQLEELNLNESSFTGGTLPQGVFSGLSALRELKLGECELQTLPGNLFSGLSALEYLSLSNNYLSELPPGLFGGLSALETVFIAQNRLSGVPEGLLSGLTNLVKFRSEANNVDPLPFTVTLEKVGDDGFRARVLQGAPFDIELPLNITGGTIDGGTTSLTVSKGSVESTTLEVTRPDGSTEAVVVDIGTLPDLPPDFDPNLGATFGRYHQGYELAKSDDLPLEVLPQPDSTTIELTVEPTEVAEEGGATTLTVTAMLNAAVRTDAAVVTLIVGASGDSATATTDYTTGAVPTLTIAAEERSGSETFTLTPVDDTDGEGDETVTIAGTVTVETLTVNGTEVTIIDDDATPVPVTLALTSGPGDDTYAIGNVIEATATFTAAVTVTGTPQLELDIGGKPRLADCALATDTTKLACTYTVAEGDEDTDGIAIEANKLSLNGAVITLGTDAVTPTHAAVTDDSGHKVDGVRPELTDAATSADGTKVVLTYDQTLSATTAATGAFTVRVASANIEATTPAISAVAASDKTVTLTIGTAVKAGQTVTVDYADPNTGDDANAVQDAAGNDAASLAGQAVTNTVPEDATVSALSVALSSATLTEGGDAVTVTVTIAAGATFATDRSVALAWGGEALAPNAGLIREPSGRSEVLIAAGESSATAMLTGVERAAYTVATTRTLTATFDDADETAIGTGLDLTYMDSGSAPEASISATPAMVPEGDDITVEVTLTRAFDIDVAVTLTMADTEGVVSGTLPTGGIAIAANETTGTVTLSTTADMMTGADASVVFTLGDATNEPYSLGTPATVTVTVLDDTSASDEITLSVVPATVDEDATETALSVTATLNRAVRTTATDVALSIAGGTATEITDFRATTVTLTIAANAQSGTAPLTLTPVNDTIIEPDETVTIEGTATGFTVIGAEVSILDADEPAITLSFVQGNFRQIDEDAGPLAVGLTATTAGSTAPTRDIVVKVETVLILTGPEATPQASPEEGDFKPFEGNYTFAANDFTLTSGQWTLTVSNDLELIDDSTVEKLESFELHVDRSTLAGHVAAPPKVLVQINNEDTATVRVATDNYQVEEGEELVFQVITSAPVDFPFSVAITTVELGANFNTDQIVEELRTTFSARLANVEAYATSDEDYVQRTEVIELLAYEDGETRVQSIEDTVDEADETFLLRLVGSGLDPSLTITPNYAFVTIVDDDELPGAPTALTVDNAGPTTVTLSWTAPSNEGTQTITGYLVERSTDSDPSLQPTGTGPPPYTNIGLTPETTYHYRVSAISAAGRSEPSETVSATTAALPVMTIAVAVVNGNPVTAVDEGEGAPFIITRTGDTSEAVTVNLEWTQDGSTPIAIIDDFDVGDPFEFFGLATRNNVVDEPDGSITLTLKEGDGYTLGATTSATIIVTDDDEVPGTPVLSARPDNEQIELTWPKPTPGTSNITRYDYRRSNNNGVTWSDWTDTGVDLAQTMFSLTFENLVNGTLYSFELRALSDAGESEPSNTATATPALGPTITGIEILSTPSLCDARAYALTDEVQIGVTFSEAVSIDTSGGQPYLSLRMEGYDANAPYKQGSGTTQLVFAKTFTDIDHSGLEKSFAVDDPAQHSARGLQLNGATIRSSADDNTAVLTGTSLGRTDNAHMIGVVMTGATVTSSPALGATYANGERLTLTADFNAPIGAQDGENSKLVLAFDSGDREADYSHFVDDKVHYGYTITDSDADANGVGIPTDALKLNGARFGRPGIGPNFVPCNEAIEMVSSDTVDGVRPTLVTTAPDAPVTSADGTQILLTFDEELSTTTAGTGDFEVTVSAMERTVTDVEVDADDNTLMKLTLGSALGMMDTITVSYTDPSADNDTNAVQDAVGNDVLSFAGQSVSNNAPAGVTVTSIDLTSAAGTDETYAIGDVVTATVTLSEAVSLTGTPQLELDVGAAPRTADCALAADTTKLECTYTIVADDEDTDGIAIEANKLSLNGASLSKTSGDPGGVVLTHTAVAADSDHKVDGVKPTLSSANASGDLTKVVLTFSEAIGTVDNTKITVKKGGTTENTTGAAIDSTNSTKVEITLMTAFLSTDTNITVELDADAVTDVPGNGIDEVSSMAVSLVDTTPPTLTGAGTTSTTEILLSFDEALDSNSIPSTSQFVVTVGGASRTVSSVALSGTMGISLTLSSAFGHDDTLVVAYTVPSTNPIRDEAENEAAAFTTGSGGVAAVVNNVPPPPAVISTIALTSDAGADKTYGIDDEIEVTVTFDTAVDITGAPTFEIYMGGQPKDANCMSGTNTTTMVCTYDVVLNDTTSRTVGQDVVNHGVIWVRSAVDLNGGTIRNTGTTVDATLTNSRLNFNTNHLVDGIRPTLVTTGDDAPKTSTDGTKIILTFSENVALDVVSLSSTSFTVTIDGTAATVDRVASDPPNSIEVTLDSADTVSAGEAVTVAFTANVVTDVAGNQNDAQAATSVTNNSLVSPTVIGVALTSDPGNDDTYAIGDVVEATVTFSEAVDITGTPQLELDFAGTGTTADCAAHGTDTTKLVCSHTVVETNSAPNGIAIAENKLTLNSATIKEAGSTTVNATLTHNAEMIDSDHKVDGVRPTPTRASADGTALTLVWSEPLNTGSTPAGTAFTVGVSSGTAPMVSSVAISASTATLTLSAAVDVDQDIHARLRSAHDQPHRGRGGEPRSGVQRGDRLDDRPDVELQRHVRHDREREPGHRRGRRCGDRDRNDHQ